ncbi:MAG: ATP-binding cassette domain-containing protein [Pseudomonadota bacterium]
MLTLEQVRFERGAFSLSADWSLKPGARVAVIGPSGGGKSTLLSLISGFETPSRGRVIIDDEDQTGRRPGKRPLSVVFQEGNLFPHLTVAQNVGMGLSPSLRLGAREREAVADVLKRVGLSDTDGRKPAALSGGQRARVALARVLLRDKPLLLLDEAFSALGPALKDEMFELLDAVVGADTTTVMVTHDPLEASRMGEMVVVDDGVAAAPAEAGPLLADPSPQLRAYLGRG